MEKQMEKVEVKDKKQTALSEDTLSVDVNITKKKTGGKKVARRTKSVVIDENLLEENAKLDDVTRTDETATSYEEANKYETEYRQFCVPIRVWFEENSDYLKELKKNFKAKYDSASQELVAHVLDLVTDEIKKEKPSENSAEPKTVIKRNMAKAKKILKENQNKFFASVNQAYNDRAKKFNDAWEKIYITKGKNLVDSSELGKTTNPEQLYEKALLDVMKAANVPTSGKNENYFNRAAKNMARYAQYRQILRTQEVNAEVEEEKLALISDLANAMETYADQKNETTSEKKVPQFELKPKDEKKIIYPRQNADIVEKEFWDQPILTEEEIKEEIQKRLKENSALDNAVDENQKQMKEYSSSTAVNMIVKGIYNGLRWGNLEKELSKEERDELRQKLSFYFEDEKVTEKQVMDTIDAFSKNYDAELALLEEDIKQKEEAKDKQEKDVTWEKIKQMVGSSKESHKERDKEWERIIEASKAEDVRLRPLYEVREGIVGFDTFDNFVQGMTKRVNATLINYEVPQRYLDKVRESMKTLYFQKKEFKKDSDTYTKDFASLVIKEMKQVVIPSLLDTKKSVIKDFEACVQGMSKVKGSFTNANEVKQFVQDNSHITNSKDLYWNDEDMYLNQLHEMAKDTTNVDESRAKNIVADAIYQNANKFERMAYALEPECLENATYITTESVGQNVLDRVNAAINQHKDFSEFLKSNSDFKETIVSHIACEVVLGHVEEEELNVEAFRNYVTSSVNARKNANFADQFEKSINQDVQLRVDEFYRNIVVEKGDLKDRFSELLTKGLSQEEINLELKKYTKEDNEVAVNEVIKNYEENGVSDYKAFLDVYLSRTRNIDNLKFSKLTREYKNNLAFIKKYYKLDDVTLKGEEVSYEDKIKALEIKDKDAVKHLADFAKYLQANHAVNLERYMKLKGSLPFDIEQKMKENPKYFQMSIMDHYNHLQDELTKDENGFDNLKNYDYRNHYRFLRRKDVGVERGSFPKRVGAFFARHWYKVASVGLLGYLAVSAMLFVPATTSFIGFIGGAALTYVGGAILNTVLLGKLPFFKDVIRNRRVAYGLSCREVERSTRRVDELMNGRHMGIGYIFKKIFTFGQYNKNGSITDRLDEANRLLDRMQSMSMKNPKQVKRTYKRIQKLLKAKGDGILETENGTGIKYTSKFAKKIAKRLGIDENTASTEVTDKDYVDMFLNHNAEELHYDSTVEYNKGKVLGIFGKTRSVGYAIERLENHDKYATKMSNVWKITDAEGNVSYKKCKKNAEPVLRRGESAEQLSVIDNYVDDFNNLVDEGKSIVSSTRILLAKAERAYANNLRRVEKRMPEEELAQLKYEYTVNHKAAQTVMKSRREVNAEIKAEYNGIKNDRKSATKGYSQEYEEDKKRQNTSTKETIDFEAMNFDTMPVKEKEKIAFQKVTFDDEADKKEVEKIKEAKSKKEQIAAINKLVEKREKKMREVLASVACINSMIDGQSELQKVLEDQSGVTDVNKPILTQEEREKLEKERVLKIDRVVKYFKANKNLVKAVPSIKYSITEEILKNAGIDLDTELE